MDISVIKAVEYSLLGIALVFLIIVILMIVVKIMSNVVGEVQKQEEWYEKTHPAPKKAIPAPGSAGEVKLYGVSERDAAMLMAIVADTMKKPLNELRFISIREVSEDEV